MEKVDQTVASQYVVQDSSRFDSIQGYLQKKSQRWGAWQKRYFCFSNQYLNYFKTQKMVCLKATCNLAKLTEEASLVGRFGEFQLNMGDKIITLRAKDVGVASQWIKSINERYQYYSDPKNTPSDLGMTPSGLSGVPSMRGSKYSSEGSIPDFTNAGGRYAGNENDTTLPHQIRGSVWEAEQTCLKEGWLDKKSPSRFKAWQARYFRVIDGAVYYYKSEAKAIGDFQGRILLNSSCEITPETDEEQSLYLIRIKTNFRSFLLKSASHEHQEEWVTFLKEHQTHKVKQMTDIPEDEVEEAEIAEEEVAPVEELIPEWIIAWDHTEEAQRISNVQDNLNKKFKGFTSDLELVTQVCSLLIDELQDLSSECLGAKEPRVDILQVYTKMYHVKFEQEIGVFLVGEAFENLSTQEILRLMDIITAYGEYLESILAHPSCTDIRSSIPEFSMIDNVEKMAARYLEELQYTLGTWVENITANNLSRGDTAIERLTAGSTVLDTCAPVDIFNMIHETITMAKASGVEQLIGPVVSCCLITLVDYVTDLSEQLSSTPRGREMVGDLEFLCALTNDCSLIVEHLDQLEKSPEGKAAIAEGADFEAVRHHFDQAAFHFIEFIQQMIFGDLKQLSDILFTSEHLSKTNDDPQNNVMARIVATVEDYSQDLKEMLYPEYFMRILKRLGQEISLLYCKRFLSKSSVYLQPAKFVDRITRKKYDVRGELLPLTCKVKLNSSGISHIKDDLERLFEMFSGFMPSSRKLFAQETITWHHMIDLLTVSPAAFPGTVVAIAKSQPEILVQAVVASGLCVLSSRLDISASQMDQIQQTMGIKIQEHVAGRSKDESSSGTLCKNNEYGHLWPSLTIQGNLQSKVSSFVSQTRSKMDKKPSMRWKPSKRQQELVEEKTELVHVRLRAGTLAAVVDTELTLEASQKRRERRQSTYEVKKQIKRVNLHGYMEKKSPHPPIRYQKRWFSVREVRDELGCKRMCLSWHKSPGAPEKSRLYIDQIVNVEITGSIPIRLAADGVTLVLDTGNMKNDKLLRHCEFSVMTNQPRTFTFRTASMSEVILWVNGLKKAVRETADGTLLDPLVENDMEEEEEEEEEVVVVTGAASAATMMRRMSTANTNASYASVAEPVDTLDELDEENSGAAVVAGAAVAATAAVAAVSVTEASSASGAGVSREAPPPPIITSSSTPAPVTQAAAVVASDGAACASPVSAGLIMDPDERFEREAELRHNIARGLLLLEDANQEEVDIAAVEQAISIFEQVSREASSVQARVLEGRAIHGMAAAYTLSEERIEAAPIMFELASKIFYEVGEYADAFSCVADAAATYRTCNQPEEAIRCLVEYDAQTDSLEFADTIAEIRAEMQPQTSSPRSSDLQKQQFFIMMARK